MNFRLMNTTDLVSDDWLEDNVSPRVIDQVLQPAYEDWQDRENQRNPSGLVARLQRWVSQ